MDTLLFITAPGLDHKALNHILLQLRDWEFGGSDWLNLVTTKNAYNLSRSPEDTAANFSNPTKPPVPTDIDNAWAGASLEVVEAFLRDAGEQPYFVLVDAESVARGTCIFAAARLDEEAEPARFLDAWRKMRVPCSEAYAMFANVSLANMRFEEWADGSQDDGSVTREWYTYAGLGRDTVGVDGVKARDEEIERFRVEGKV